MQHLMNRVNKVLTGLESISKELENDITLSSKFNKERQIYAIQIVQMINNSSIHMHKYHSKSVISFSNCKLTLPVDFLNKSTEDFNSSKHRFAIIKYFDELLNDMNKVSKIIRFYNNGIEPNNSTITVNIGWDF